MLGGASRACEFDPSPFAAPEYSVLGMHAWLALAVQVVCVVFVCRGQGLSGPAQGRVWAAARGTGDETRHGGGSHFNGGTFSNLTQHSSRSQTLAINNVMTNDRFRRHDTIVSYFVSHGLLYTVLYDATHEQGRCGRSLNGPPERDVGRSLVDVELERKGNAS